MAPAPRKRMRGGRLGRLGTGEKILGASAILLFVFMFFDWFGAEVSGVEGFSGSVSGAGSAWDVLDLIPIVLLLTIVVALIAVGLRLAEARPEPTLPISVLVTALGVVSVLLILFRIVDPPALESLPGVSTDATLEPGIFLSLLAAGGIAYGGYGTMREEGISFAAAADRLSEGRDG